ncbi:MAG: DUF1569 domain-containing protein [Saprospiraceae bacterium]|nr:DUF1569 domain-containing protein [Lewinellaceae bacterium]
MGKPSIFNSTDYTAICRRIDALRHDSGRLWGTMTPDQMLAHCCMPLEQGLGKIELPPEGNLLTRWLIKQFVLRADRFRPNLPTAKAFVICETAGFEAEKARLLANISETHQRGPAGPWAPHNLFGAVKPVQWGRLCYVHLDHHLRQFGV